MSLILNLATPFLNLGGSLEWEAVMIHDEDCVDGVMSAANDNGSCEKAARIDEVVLRIARLIGRQMAREQFEPPSPANDNKSNETEIST